MALVPGPATGERRRSSVGGAPLSGEGFDHLLSGIERTHALLELNLRHSVQTLDTLVYEHETAELPSNAQTFTVELQPQTSQVERITGLMVAIVNPTKAAAPVITIDNAWAQLGNDFVNLNATLNSAAGNGGSMENLGLILWSQDKRSFTVHATSDFPSGCYITAALFGHAVPATIADVLH
jgi:hypothetical protein